MHDVDLARRFADRIIGMSGGQVVFDGPPDGLTDEHAEDDLRRRGAGCTEPACDEHAPIAPRQAVPGSPLARAGWLLLVVYVVYAMSSLDFTSARFVIGLDNGAKFIERMFPPQLRAAGPRCSRA